MCASEQQNQIQAEDIQQMQQYDAQQAKVFQENQALYATVNSVLQPILQAGPNQTGFSQTETNALNAQAVEGTAENYQNAARAVNENIAAEGGEGLPTGAAEQLRQEVANSAAGQQSAEETQIQEANYQQGRQNFQNAEEGELAIASGENPVSYSQAATGQSNAAGNEANAIAQENTSWINAAIGAGGAILGGVARSGGFSGGGSGGGADAGGGF